MKFDLTKPDELVVCAGEIDKETKCLHIVKVPRKYYLAQEECFIKSVSGEKLPYFPDVCEGLKAQKVVDAVLKSAETQEMVNL